MTTQPDYTAKEWNLLLQAPILASLIIIQADQYRLTTVARKTFAALAAIMETAQRETGTELIDAVAAAVREGQAPWWPDAYPSEPDAALRWALLRCRQVAALLAQKVPEAEAEAFARWLLSIGQRVAQVAAPPGPLDPQGGEHTALRRLAAALDLPVSESVGLSVDRSA